MDYASRIATVRAAVQEHGADAYVVTGSAHTFYLSGFYTPMHTTYPVVVIPADGDPVLLTSQLDAEEAVDTSAVAVEVPDGLQDGIAAAVPGDRVLVDGDTSVRLKRMLEESFTVEVDTEILHGARAIKDGDEIERIREAYRVAETAVDAAIDDIQESMTEQDIAAELEYVMRRNGSMGVPFPTVVASGERARVPHHTTADRGIGEGPLLFDCGARIGGYVSDLSRTVHVGGPSDRFREAYTAVRRAQSDAAEILAAGVPAAEIDAAARAVLAETGFEETFPHATGHGIGITVHEDPRISRDVETEVVAGNVVTLEPGLYIDGTGIRIEDAYHVTENGAERLTTGSRELRIVDR